MTERTRTQEILYAIVGTVRLLRMRTLAQACGVSTTMVYRWIADPAVTKAASVPDPQRLRTTLLPWLRAHINKLEVLAQELDDATITVVPGSAVVHGVDPQPADAPAHA